MAYKDDSVVQLRRIIERAPKDLDRLVVVHPRREDDRPYIEDLHKAVGRRLPRALGNWEMRLSSWSEEYRGEVPTAAIVEVNLKIAVYVFDRARERVLMAYGLSSPQLEKRNPARMRRFPDVNVSIRARLGSKAFLADRGHFLGHAAGGVLDINLFPHRRELNRGWSQEGRVFREMERYAAEHLGTFMYHRAIYDDDTWIPNHLEYGLLLNGRRWWVNEFQNR